jgi:hypothetical protein
VSKRVVDLKEFRDRAGRDERRAKAQLYPKSGLVQVSPRRRPASSPTSPPVPGGGVGLPSFDDGPDEAA